MKNFLIVVDMQKDFVDGTLGTKEAQDIVPLVCDKIKQFKGDIFVTLDTHFKDYLTTSEGKKLPVEHCIKNTDGWRLDKSVEAVLKNLPHTRVEKITFGSVELPKLIKNAAQDDKFNVELVGLCTDICVVSNAILLKAHFPEAEILVDSACCAGVTPELHLAALSTMQSCQINVK